MPRTREQLEQAAADAERWLDDLDPDDPNTDVSDPADLRAIGQALSRVATAENELADAVHTARAQGRGWGLIGMALGISRQAARQRYGEPAIPSQR